MRSVLLTIAVLFLIAGCSRKNPVTEVTVAESGVEIVDSKTPIAPESWPFWRGPTSDGVAPQQELVSEWDETKNVKWRAEIPGRGHSSPIVVGDSLFIATAIDDSEQQCVMSLSREDGTEKWRTVVHSGGFPSKREVHQKGTHANGTLACDGTRLFTAFLNSDKITATALSLEGEILWQQAIGEFASKFGYAPSPVLYKSLVIFAADNRGGGYLSAVDAATGEIAWRVSRGNVSSYSSPTVARVGGRDQLLISGCDAVTSYDPASGQQLWRTPCIAEATCGTIVATADKIFASGGYPDRETVCLSAAGERLWSNNARVYEPSMVVAGEKLIAVNDDGIAYAWETESGKELWKERLGGNFSASPILCGGRIYASNLAGDTFVFTPTETFELVSENHLGDDCYASPAAVGGELYLRIGVGKDRERREQIVCIAAADEAQ